MRRQGAGLAVLGLALLAALVAPAPAGARRIAGEPTAAPVPGPAKAGDCLTHYDLGMFTDPTDAGVDYHYSSIALQACAGARYGEVATRIPVTPSVTADKDQPPDRGSTDPYYQQCQSAAAGYLGLPADVPAIVGASPDTLFSYWAPTFAYSVGLSLPSARQIAAHQHWLACVVYAPDLAGGTAVLDGSVRGALASGVGRNAFGECVIDADLSVGSVPGACHVAHDSEVFGTAEVTGASSISRATLTATCRQLIARLTGLPDVTAGGRLLVTVFGGGQGAEAYLTGAPVLCAVTAVGAGKLTGSLRGLGSQPIPWG